MKELGIYFHLLLGLVLVCSFLVNRRLKTLRKDLSTFKKKAERHSEISKSHLAFVEKIDRGDYSMENHFQNDDELGNRLYEMSLQFKQAADNEKLRSWEMSGLNDVASILRSSTDITSSFKKLISFLVNYISANQGGLFILSKDEKEVSSLELVSCFAYERHKIEQKCVGIGEGLIGQCVLEKDIVYLERVPENYVHITSGLGLATPRSLVIVPLKYADDVVGVVELASFTPLLKHHLEFLRKAAEIIGASVLTWKKNIYTNSMLDQSRQMAEELKAQQEEARQNLEELQATQEHLTREAKEREKLQLELNKSKEFLNLVLDSVPVPVFVKDRQHKMVLVNKAVCDLNNMTKDQMIGKSDYDFFEKEEADVFWQFEEDIFLSGKGAEKMERATRNGRETHTIDKKLVVKTDNGEHFLVGINIDLMQTADVAVK